VNILGHDGVLLIVGLKVELQFETAKFDKSLAFTA
jgi:hypothetical protein